jgi:hypothetical protein
MAELWGSLQLRFHFLLLTYIENLNK